MQKNTKIFLTIGVALGGVIALSKIFEQNATSKSSKIPQIPSSEPERTSMFTGRDEFFSSFTAKDDFFSYVGSEGDFFNGVGNAVPVATDEPNFANASGGGLVRKSKKIMKKVAHNAKKLVNASTDTVLSSIIK